MTQASLFGDAPQHPAGSKCHVCGVHGTYGFGPRGAPPGPRWRYFCDSHRDQGEAYWRQINGRPS